MKNVWAAATVAGIEIIHRMNAVYNMHRRLLERGIDEWWSEIAGVAIVKSNLQYKEKQA